MNKIAHGNDASSTVNLSKSATFQSRNWRASSGSRLALSSSDCLSAANSKAGISISPSVMLCVSSLAFRACAGAGFHMTFTTRKGVSCRDAEEATLRSGVNIQIDIGRWDPDVDDTVNFRRPSLSIELKR
jgi:hypothetical protein